MDRTALNFRLETLLCASQQSAGALSVALDRIYGPRRTDDALDRLAADIAAVEAEECDGERWDGMN